MLLKKLYNNNALNLKIIILKMYSDTPQENKE